MKYKRRRVRKSRPMINDIPLTPLIDTALTLLIIFMITAPMMHNAIKINLPQGNAQEDRSKKHELVVYVDKEGKLFINGVAYQDDGKLIADLKERVGAETQKTVFVKADQAVNYGSVITLVDKLKVIGGIQYVALATTKRT